MGSKLTADTTDLKPTALEVAQQIIDQFEPGHTVVSWRTFDDQPKNTVELTFSDGTARKLVGLFAHHILSADYRDTHRC